MSASHHKSFSLLVTRIHSAMQLFNEFSITQRESIAENMVIVYLNAGRTMFIILGLMHAASEIHTSVMLECAVPFCSCGNQCS